MKKDSKKFLFHSISSVLVVVAMMASLFAGATVAYAGGGGDDAHTYVEQWDGSSAWVTGTVTYQEGGIIPYKMYLQNQNGDTRSFEISYQFQPTPGKYFFDYLTTYPSAYNGALSAGSHGITGSPTMDYAAIPASPDAPISAASSGQVLTGYNFNFKYPNESGSTESPNDDAKIVGSWGASDSTRAIEFKGVMTNNNAWVTWGAHLATEADWGTGNGASYYWPSAKHLDVDSVTYAWHDGYWKWGQYYPGYYSRGTQAIGSLNAKAKPVSATVVEQWNGSSAWTTSTVTYSEGGIIPYRMYIKNQDDETQIFEIRYDFQLIAGKYFFDYLTTYPSAYNSALTIAGAAPGVSGGIDDTATIPTTYKTDGVTVLSSGQQLRGYNFEFYYPNGDGGNTNSPNDNAIRVGSWTNSDNTRAIEFKGKATSNDAWITWGAHLANAADWGAGNGASAYYPTPRNLDVSKVTYCVRDTTLIQRLQATTPLSQVTWIFDVNGVSNFTGTVLIVNGTPYALSPGFPYTLTFLTTDTVNFAYQSPLVADAGPFIGTQRFVWDHTTGAPSGNAINGSFTAGTTGGTVTGYYNTQYLLTLNINPGTVPGGLANISGGTNGAWYDAGTALSLAATDLVADGAGKRWDFRNWTGDVSSPPNTSNPVGVIMNAPRDITANYVAQYLLTMTTSVGTVVPGNGWWDEGTVVPIGANAGSNDYTWGGWTGTGNISFSDLADTNIAGIKSGDSVTMNSPVSEDALWIYSPTPSVGGPQASSTLQPVIMINTLGRIEGHPVTPDGALINNVIQTSDDGSLTIEIPAGTIVLNAEGKPQYLNYNPFYHTVNTDITAELAGTPAAPQGATIVRAYQINPSGVTFKGNNATVTAKYEPSKAPQGKSLVWAFYDEKAQKWVDLETGGVVAGGSGLPNSLSCKTSHLTYFAILAK